MLTLPIVDVTRRHYGTFRYGCVYLLLCRLLEHGSTMSWLGVLVGHRNGSDADIVPAHAWFTCMQVCDDVCSSDAGGGGSCVRVHLHRDAQRPREAAVPAAPPRGCEGHQHWNLGEGNRGVPCMNFLHLPHACASASTSELRFICSVSKNLRALSVYGRYTTSTSTDVHHSALVAKSFLKVKAC